MDRETHKFNFKRWERMEEINAKGLDRLLEFIGTGTFALSLTLITGFGPEKLEQPWFMIFSWVFFGFAILIHILAYVYALNGLGAAKQRLLKIPIYTFDPRTPEEKAKEERLQRRFSITNSILRWAVLLLMTFGMVLLIMFASANLLKKSQIHLEPEIPSALDFKG